MFELMDLGRNLLPTNAGIDIQLSDIHIDIEPTEYLFPSVHIDGHINIHFPW